MNLRFIACSKDRKHCKKSRRGAESLYKTEATARRYSDTVLVVDLDSLSDTADLQ